MIVPLERAFGWSAGTISAAISHEYPAARTDRTVHHRSDGDARPEAHHPALPPGLAGRHRAVDLHVDPVGAVPHLGIARWHRCQRRRGRHGGGHGQSLVRHASRPGDGIADLGERGRSVDLPADARPAVAGLRLAERLHCGDPDGGCADPAGASCCRKRRPASDWARSVPTSNRPRRHAAAIRSALAIDGLFRGVRSIDFWLLAMAYRDLRLLHQRPDRHAPDRVLRRSWLLAVRRRRHPGIARHIQPDRLDRLGLADRPLQSAHPAVLDLRSARAVADAAALHQLRHGQPDCVRRVLRAGLDRGDAADLRTGERGVRQEGRAGDHVVDLRHPPDRRRPARRWARASCARGPAATCWRSWQAASRACWRRCWCCASRGPSRRWPRQSSFTHR